MKINPLEIILKKRNGNKLSKSEIHSFINAYTKGEIPDYQMAAWLMAVYFQGMHMDETVALTESMLMSGERIDLSNVRGGVVDKHSTGGVGDKTSLILAPMVASLGVKVAKLSGRGLGHSGGTIDKLESIKGFNVHLSLPQFIHQVNKIGMALMGQTQELVPADKKLYALRDVTATVNCLPLIASSIISKKLASGADTIVLDVKTGSGSFNSSTEQAIELAKLLVHLGERMGKTTVALITEMDQPLGNAIGNSLEVKEAIDTLSGRGPNDLQQLCIELGSYMVHANDLQVSLEKAKYLLTHSLQNGTAMEKFEAFVQAQGGDIAQIRYQERLPVSKTQIPIHSETEGYITNIKADLLGKTAMLLGAGRMKKSDSIDHAVGIYLEHKVGAYVKKGDTLAHLHVNHEENLPQALSILKTAYSFGKEPARQRPLIWAKVDKNGIEMYAQEQ